MQGNVGIGTTTPKRDLHIKASNDNPVIIENGWANTDRASALLNSQDMANRTLIIGGPWGDKIYFYWKDQNGKKYMATLTGRLLPTAVIAPPVSFTPVSSTTVVKPIVESESIYRLL